MGSIWERFDTIAKPEEVVEVKMRNEPLDEGIYKMVLEEIKATTSKTSKLPMLAIKFRITGSNKIFYYNQVLQSTFSESLTVKNVATAVKVVEGIIGEEIDFVGLNQLESIIESIPVGETYNVKISYEPKYKDTKQFPILDFIKDEDMETFEEDTEF